MVKLRLGFVMAATCFVPSSSFAPRPIPSGASATRRTQLAFSTVGTELLALELEKPLGLILEEVEEGAPKGVFVLELSEDGSAAASEYKDKLPGLKIATVMGEDVTSLAFDDVMDKLINAPSPVALQLILEGAAAAAAAQEEDLFPDGTPVTIAVLEEGKPQTSIQAKVGDNLRQVLLDNNIEVYKGLKKKLGNCGGGGQCTFCAAEFVESEGWEPRSDYENKKLKKNPNARLTCLNNIQGPATIKI
jgi:ferredoxin